MELIEYRIEVVGGPFDGAGSGGGMMWRDDGGHPAPEVILVGVCPGDGSCGSAQHLKCKRQARNHVYFWLPDEPDRPVRVKRYELSESFIEPEAEASLRIARGRAIYVIGGLLLPEAREGQELVGAGTGVSEGGVYASAFIRDICAAFGISVATS